MAWNSMDIGSMVHTVTVEPTGPAAGMHVEGEKGVPDDSEGFRLSSYRFGMVNY